MRQVVVFRDESKYAAFPDVTLNGNGDLLLVFRLAPRRLKITHIDPRSRAMLMRSCDGGLTWSDPEVVQDGGPNCGIQDPSIVCLADGTVLVDFFRWSLLAPSEKSAMELACETEFGPAVAEGPFIVRSTDCGDTWSEPVWTGGEDPISVRTSDAILPLRDGSLLLPAYGVWKHLGEQAGGVFSRVFRAAVLRSRDGGLTWGEHAVVAHDPTATLSFCEPALLRMPDERTVALLRTGDQARPRSEHAAGASYLYQSVSQDGGYAWSPPICTGVWGHPPDLLLLDDGRVLCTYGYRRPPFGIRAVLSADGGNTWDKKREIILRADGGSTDLGYPSSVQLPDGSVLTVYYFNDAPDSARYIAASRWWVP